MLELHEFDERQIWISVFNMHGKKYFEKTLSVPDGRSNISLSLPPDLIKGTYIIHVNDGQDFFSSKLLVR